MKRRDKIFIYSIALLILAVSLSGCSFKMGDYIPNSHFAFPNSNVEPLGHVSAEVSRTGFFNAALVDKELIKEVMDQALKQKGGDILINYKMDTTVSSWVILPIYTTTLHVEGTACKMTVGRQELQ
ncbi:MAG: hypothetical protein KAU60_06760 [Desulfobacterales bacterium]|nr:hypothetical protein [Desulfobacterales bacterium]